MRRSKRSEQGSSLAWTAAFLTTVFLPLMLLVVDGTRLLYVRGRLQTATDAACEAAAWTAGDRLAYTNTGQTQIGNEGEVYEVAFNTFLATLNERTRMAFAPVYGLTLDDINHQVLCSASAEVPVLFSAAGGRSSVTLSAFAATSLRFR